MCGGRQKVLLQKQAEIHSRSRCLSRNMTIGLDGNRLLILYDAEGKQQNPPMEV